MPIFFDDNSFVPVTAILDSGGNQIFETVGIMGVSAASSIAYPQHTLENGVAISDHSIQLQDRVTVRCVLNPSDYTEVFRRIKKAFRENAAFIIQTKVETYTNLYIETLPHEEDAKDTVLLSLEFLEQRFQSPTTTNVEGGTTESLPESEVANPADSDTRNAGNKQPTETSEGQSSTVLNDLLGDFI